MVDCYKTFFELAQHHQENIDYRIRCRTGTSSYAIVAPHGGRIERGTSTVAEGIAGTEHTFYAFEGCKARKNNRLHITSNHFDEPTALAAVSRVQTVISIHGAKGWESAVYAGGLDLKLRKRLLDSLCAAGFVAADDPSPTRQGRGITNVCNRGLSGQGVQLELTAGLRQAMLLDPNHPDTPNPNGLYFQFITAVRAILT